jgi:glutamate/tyrosine decarboxylase-like PLP-dependent enzyme
MDLTTLKRNLSKGRIHTMAEFQRDLMLMFQNAVMYNDSDHHIYHMAVEMQREVLEQIQVLSNADCYRAGSGAFCNGISEACAMASDGAEVSLCFRVYLQR